MKKIFKKIFLLIFIILLILISILTITGYSIYKNTIEEMSLEDKISNLENNANYVYYNELPNNYINAVIAIEDHRFKTHNGIDIISFGRAMLRNIKEFEFVEGGSTITQQVAKNLYFSQEKKLLRKIAELFVAFDIEKNYEKEKIFEIYVNTNYFGSGYYGIKEAAKGYFNKNLNELTLEECALLAGIPNAPSVYSLDTNPDLAHERAKYVINAMKEHGYL